LLRSKTHPDASPKLLPRRLKFDDESNRGIAADNSTFGASGDVFLKILGFVHAKAKMIGGDHASPTEN